MILIQAFMIIAATLWLHCPEGLSTIKRRIKLREIGLVALLLGFCFGNNSGEIKKTYSAQDYQTKIELLQKACDNGEAQGCSDLGIMYRLGKGVEQDNSKAAQLFKKASSSGDATAYSNLGIMYDFGKGVKQDSFKAAKFYQKACDGGNPAGCSNLGIMYEDGKGVKQSKQQALEYYGKACEMESEQYCKDYARLKKESIEKILSRA
ncbi:MAG TPA: hypothetical protein CFH81_00070 [Sulfurovum sp. UBA12169]|nr:MAG TPA: hypothetical protein CFH81_00070 [Sulfurovum sp. UBA12169]